MTTDEKELTNPAFDPENHDTGYAARQEFGALFRKIYSDVYALIEGQASEQDVYELLTQRVLTIPHIQSSSLFVFSDTGGPFHELKAVAASGEQEVPEPLTAKTKSGTFKAVDGGTLHPYQYKYFKIVALRKHVGWLGICASHEVDSETSDFLQTVTFLAGVAYERPHATKQIQHLSNKLEVLNELNKLIASGSGVERICRTIAREAAFRFGAECALVLLLPESEEDLDIVGSYGCPPKSLPSSIDMHNTQIGRSLKLGGMISIPDLRVQQDHGFDFLSTLGFSCVHWSSIDIRGENLGAVVIGYREQKELSEFEGDMLEEFARATAVAIVSAKNREKLAKYASTLEELVEERTRDLAVQTARADEANQAKSRFVANMSHELRSPLTAIVGYSSVLAEGIFGPINNEQKDALCAIAKAAEHLKDLINDVLDISKVEAGKEDPEPAEVEIYKLIEQVFKLMMQTAMGKGVELAPVQMPENPELAALKVWVDPRHIRQILINILSNAIKYTPAGGKVSLRVERLGDKAKIIVSDTGVGVSEEQKEKLFERFHRGDDTYSRTQVGTGIGLSLTKRLTEMNGGKIGVESEVGKGSDFWVLIPLAEGAAGVPKGALALDAEDNMLNCRLDGLNVLIVDDNHSTCEVLATIIKSVGGNPYIAYSVAEGKKISQNTELDTALIDLAIPGENGLDLLDYFRKICDRPLSVMPLIVVSACVFDSDKQEALHHGASAFVPKPFSPAKIVNLIRDLTTAAAIDLL
jgi:signal transduction histidine kinase/ActR/RegA family two-component response regulator